MTEPTASEIARKMGQYIRKHGFSPEYQIPHTECGCFGHAYDRVGAGHTGAWGNVLFNTLIVDICGADIWQDDLRKAGWDESATKDAAAACDIAADLLSP